MVTLDQLQVLDAIERHGTFGRAAKELHRVPSAVSYAVRMLEEDLGLSLFERLGNRTRLSAEGARILDAGRRVLAEAKALEHQAFVMREGWEPDLHIVVDGIYPMERLALGLEALAAAEAPTRIRLDVEYQEGVPERWEADNAQLMLILDFDPEDDPLETVKLAELPLALVSTESHRGYDLVVRDSAERYRRRPKRSFEQGENAVHLSDFQSKKVAILAGIGAGWMPLHLVQDELDRGTLQAHKHWTYHPQLVWRTDRPLGRAAEVFVDALRSKQALGAAGGPG
jgi:DNA-binding transcriptional LysR family regulator